jgi:hypothetical protein
LVRTGCAQLNLKSRYGRIASATKRPDGQITSKIAAAACPALFAKIFRFTPTGKSVA